MDHDDSRMNERIPITNTLIRANKSSLASTYTYQRLSLAIAAILAILIVMYIILECMTVLVQDAQTNNS